MRVHHSRRLLVVPLLLGTALAASPALAKQEKLPKEPELLQVSAADPLPRFGEPRACGSAAGTPESDRSGWVYEPSLAVNPRDPDNLITSWTQDWSDAIVVGTSFDGGESWQQVVPPGSACTPGADPAYDLGAADSWVAFDRGGTAYLSSFISSKSNAHAAVVTTSRDGGRTWDLPAVLAVVEGLQVIDGSQVVVDPATAGTAYVVWRVANIVAGTRIQYLSATTDAGRHWSAPRPLTSPVATFSGRLVVQPDGALVAIASGLPQQPLAALLTCASGPSVLYAQRSTDGGQLWSPPVPIAAGTTTDMLPLGAAGAPDGTIWVGWQQPGDRVQIRYATSRDGGLTWRTGVVADVPGGKMTSSTYRTGGGVVPPAATLRCGTIAAPDVAVNPDGTVAVLFLDHRRDPGNTPARVTDAWLRTSRDQGLTWTEQHVAGPFDVTSAPSSDGSKQGDGNSGTGMLGDYQGLAAWGHGFAASVALAAPLAGAAWMPPLPHHTDVYFARLCPCHKSKED